MTTGMVIVSVVFYVLSIIWYWSIVREHKKKPRSMGNIINDYDPGQDHEDRPGIPIEQAVHLKINSCGYIPHPYEIPESLSEVISKKK